MAHNPTVPQATAGSAINPADFGGPIDNQYFPLEPGTTYVTQSTDGSVDRFAVTRETRVIDGVTCTVISDIATVDGALEEKTSDYFAQDKTGNVWYFGEETATYENGHVVSTEGSWLAGVNGAEPGIIMEAAPKVGDAYAQENAPGVAQDQAQVLDLNQAVSTPYGSFGHALETNEFSPLDPPGSNEHKFYVKGVGFVQAIDQATGDTEQLVRIEKTGTAHADKLVGAAGVDELSGLAGNDRLDGHGGKDVLNGGAGNDWLDGGHDKAADILHGGAGDDTLVVRTADRAGGGAGNDLIHLLDNTHFGAIDGGDENNHNLAHSKGDVLQFSGALDLTASSVASRIHGIETLSMRGHGHDHLTLNAGDILDLGTGTFDPHICHADKLGTGDAVRVEGHHGDQLSLTGGHWSEVHTGNAPDDARVFAAHAGAGNVYVLVEDHVSVHLD
jgi:Ca2+-binding RTX toxin-like protein